VFFFVSHSSSYLIVDRNVITTKCNFMWKQLKLSLSAIASRTAHFCALRKKNNFFDSILYATSLEDLFIGTVQILIIRFFKLKSERDIFWKQQLPFHCFIFYFIFLFFFLCHSFKNICFVVLDEIFFLFPHFFGWRRTEMYWVESKMNKRTVCKETIEESKNKKVFKMFAVV